METNPSEANINTLIMGRISRLEAENRELKEEMKRLEDHLRIQARPVPLEEKRQLIPGQVDKGTVGYWGRE